MTRDPAFARYNGIVARHGSTTHRIAFDYSTRSTVAICACGWREVTATRPAAHDLAGQHILDTAPGKDKWLLYHGPREWRRP